MDAQAWLIAGGLVISTIVPLGTLMWAFNERARSSREKIYDRLQEVHECVEKFRSEVSRELGAFNARITSIEARSYQTRYTDRKE